MIGNQLRTDAFTEAWADKQTNSDKWARRIRPYSTMLMQEVELDDLHGSIEYQIFAVFKAQCADERSGQVSLDTRGAYVDTSSGVQGAPRMTVGRLDR